MTSLLTPSLRVVAARLPSQQSRDGDVVEPVGAPAATSASSGTFGDVPVPPALADAFERMAAQRAVRTTPPDAGQMHAIAAAPSFGAILLDRRLPQGNGWSGWLVAPDVSYATDSDVVLEARDDGIAPRLGMVCTQVRVHATPEQLGACLGRLSAERVAVIRRLDAGVGGPPSDEAARPGVIARRDIDGDYVLTGSVCRLRSDPRVPYRHILETGIRELALSPAEVVPVMSNPVATVASPNTSRAANDPAYRWKQVAAIAAVLAVGQFGLLVHQMQADPELAPLSPGVSHAPYRSGADTAAFPWTARVLFRPEVTEAELRDWLSNEQLQIVAGPDPMGAFTLGSRQANRAALSIADDSPLAVVDP